MVFWPMSLPRCHIMGLPQPAEMTGHDFVEITTIDDDDMPERMLCVPAFSLIKIDENDRIRRNYAASR